MENTKCDTELLLVNLVRLLNSLDKDNYTSAEVSFLIEKCIADSIVDNSSEGL